MTNRLRSFLLRLLLLAVCLHAGVGVALHEATHLDFLVRLAAQAPETATGFDPAEAPLEEVHGLCAWCTAFSAQAAPSGAPPAVAAAPQTGQVRRAGETPGFVARPLRWAFAARDPPASRG